MIVKIAMKNDEPRLTLVPATTAEHMALLHWKEKVFAKDEQEALFPMNIEIDTDLIDCEDDEADED